VGDASARYEVSKGRHSSSGDAETSDDVADDVRGFYKVASPYWNKMRFLNEKYGIRRDGKNLMIGNSNVFADEKGDITIGEKRFRSTKGLWELLTSKNVNRDLITNCDQKTYKRILKLTNAHLVGYQPGGDIQISRCSKYTKVISKLFPQTRRRAALRQHCTPHQRWSPYHDDR
jgi:hypothetical protein